MIAKRLLVGLVAFGLAAFAAVAVETSPKVRAQEGEEFLVPHGNYTVDTDMCRVCHAWHADPDAGLLPSAQLLRLPDELPSDEPTETDVCFACHDGTASGTNTEGELTDETVVSAHPVLGPKDGVQVACSDCHAEHQSPDEVTKLLYRETGPETWIFSTPDDPIGDTFCYGCHGSASTLPAPFGDHGLFETSIHATLTPANEDTDITCSACHEPHASEFPYLTTANQEDLCYTCHSGADPNTANGSNPEEAFTAGTNVYTPGSVRIYHHPVAEGDQADGTRTIECASCHNSHLVDRTRTASDPARARVMDDDAGWRFLWDSPSGAYNRSPNAAAFCGTCHVSPATTSPPQLSASADVPYDVRLVNDDSDDPDGEPHDSFSYVRFTTGAKSAHGNPGYVSTKYLGCPPGQPCTLACTACHDFHGSSNAYMLRETIVSPDYRPLAVTSASWANQGGGTATLTVGTHGMAKDWIVTVAGVTPEDYNGIWTLTSVTATTVSFRLDTDPGNGSGGTITTRGPYDRPTTATITGFTGTVADESLLRTFCLTCHLEQRSNHMAGQLCTECHNHSAGTQQGF